MASVIFVVLGAAAMLQMQSTYAETTYIVGDSTGWTRPTATLFPNTNFYNDWATNKFFRVGDVLVFNFATGQDDVAQVTETDYRSCTTTNPIRTYNDGPVKFTLKDAGDYYFISTFSDHCSAGQKLHTSVNRDFNSASSLVPTLSLILFVSISLLFLL
ncbi:Plastocyanin-like protein [Corchorus olitorius]|uniref:Plastocyanin-like protein n=1 Tax=Corchorus olitorius TaxID=93759 RepID=A0A1R3GIE6_9ROSI|nr:Plastocyanin-like protein [Corchorus olitorius]